MPQSGSIGTPASKLDTPVLLVDLDKLEANIERMARIITKDAGVGWRPHTKAMKIPALAHMLQDAGAHGVTCAKLGEAEVMAAGGIRDILIANEIVGEPKITRLVNLRRHADVMVCVDSVQNVEELDRAALEKGVQLRVLIEVNVGMNRAGVEPGEPTLELARNIAPRKGLRLAGLQTWEAQAVMVDPEEEKRKVVTEALDRFVGTADICRDAGIDLEILSCGGTGTYWISAFHPGITEVEAGGGIYGDVRYVKDFHVDHVAALKVLSTVSSRSNPSRIVCDAGRKTLSTDASVPELLNIPTMKSMNFSAEHCTIQLEEPSDLPRIGEKIEFVAGYSDTTVLLHNELYGVRNGIVETIWPVLGRGMLQ